MGFFNWVMKGMGFKGDDEKKESSETTQKYSNFENGIGGTFSSQEFKSTKDVSSQFSDITGGKNLVIYAPKNNEDIKLLVECLRRREACIVNLANLKPSDADKILQFISGAVYALKGSIKRLQGDLFLMVPEGINIMTQSKS